MLVARRDIADTIQFVLERRPPLAPVLNAFGRLLQARQDVAAELKPELKAAGIALPSFSRDQAGEPLLVKMPVEGLGPIIGLAAARLLPILLENGALAPHGANLTAFFASPQPGASDQREELALAMARQSNEDFAKLAQKSGVPAQILAFAAEFVISAVFRAIVGLAFPDDSEAPWDVDGAWRHGYCPVCGSNPTIAWLDKRSVDEKNAFLSGGGGKKHMHCAICGANWHFLRGRCPACASEGEGVMEILKEKGSHGERLEICAKCGSYCPTVDLRELEKIPEMDAMAIGMMHLDMLAAEKGLTPLKASFWNTF